MEMKFQLKEISAALLDWDLKEFHQTHEAWKLFDWKSNIVYMTLPGGIFLSLLLSDSVRVSHASCDFLLSVFHQFVRVDVAPQEADTERQVIDLGKGALKSHQWGAVDCGPVQLSVWRCVCGSTGLWLRH